MTTLANSSANGAKPKVYSYIRFSTPEQAKGRSEGRQTELAEQYAAKHGMVLDKSLKMADRGTSAFKGANIHGGALGAFLKGIKKGHVPKGSVLIVENIDRITRMEFFDAFEVLAGILRSGVKIHTTSPEVTYDIDCAKDGRIYALIGQVTLAHDESSKKSKRLKDAWSNLRKRARVEKRPQSITCPKWLRPVIEKADGKLQVKSYEVVPEAAIAIRLIFQLRLKGHGKVLIAKKLNREGYWAPVKKRKRGVPVPGQKGRWIPSYVAKILENRALLGEFQPHEKIGGKRKPVGDPITGIYPRIVEQKTFERVQKLIRGKQGKKRPGRIGGANNLFTGIVKCAYCGGSMAYQPKGPPPKGRVFLICERGRTGGGCDRSYAVRYDEFQETILDNCAALRPEVVLPQEEDQEKQCDLLRHEIDAGEARLQILLGEIENFEDLAGRYKSREVQDSYEAKANLRRKEKHQVESKLSADRDSLKQAELTQTSVKQWSADLKKLKEAIRGQDDTAVENRSALRAHLAELIEKIEVFAHGFRHKKGGAVKEPKESGLRLPGPDADAKDVQLWRQQALQNMPVSRTTGGLEDWLDAVFEEARPRPGSNPISKAKRRAFAEFFVKQQMSKAGRFFRVHFRTKVVTDFVPQGSFAQGWRLRGTDEKLSAGRSIERVSPPLDVIWKKFTHQRYRT